MQIIPVLLYCIIGRYIYQHYCIIKEKVILICYFVICMPFFQHFKNSVVKIKDKNMLGIKKCKKAFFTSMKETCMTVILCVGSGRF